MSNQNTNRLIQPSKAKLDLEIKPKIIMPSLWILWKKSSSIQIVFGLKMEPTRKRRIKDISSPKELIINRE